MDVYRTPEDRFSNLPGYDFAPRYLEQARLSDDGDQALRMHYVDEGAGDVVLLLHGEPTWSFLYRKMIPSVVAAGDRVVAPDYFGFGRSDKPVDIAWYTAEHHVESIKRLVLALDLRGITIVVQDWGGPIGFRVATEMEDRFDRLVILNTGVFSGHNRMPDAWWAFRDFVDRTKPDIPIGMLVERACLNPLSPEVLAAYEAPFPVPESKWGASAFPLIVPTSPESPGAREMMVASEKLNSWNKPAMVAFSDSDPVFPVSVGQRFADRIPGAAGRMIVIEGAAHFLQEEKGEVIAQHIIDFLHT